MVEIIALIFLTKQIGELAYRKGLKTTSWKIYTILAWFGFEFIGAFISVMLFSTDNLVGIMLFALVCAFGGYLLIRAILLKKPDAYDEDIENIGHT